MILFNITCHIERDISNNFEAFYTRKFNLDQGFNELISEVKLLKLLTEIDDNTFTYSIQLKFTQMPYYQQFMMEAEDILLGNLQQEFAGKIFTFTTLLQEIE